MTAKHGGRANRQLTQNIKGLRKECFGSVVTSIMPDGTRTMKPATYFQYSAPGHARPDMGQFSEYERGILCEQ